MPGLNVSVVSHLLSRASGSFVQNQIHAARQFGVDISIIALRKPWEKPVPNAVNRTIWTTPRGRPRSIVPTLESLSTDRVARFVSGQDTNLVHAHAFVPDGLVGLEGSRPLIISCHTASPRAFYRHRLDWVGRVALRADRVVIPNARLRSRIVEDLELDPSRVVVVPNCVADDFFSHFAEPTGDDQSSHVPRIIWVGGLASHKNPSLAVEALRCIQREEPKASLTIVGTGPLMGKLKSQSGDLNHVCFSGRIPNERLPRVMASHNVLLSSSDYESFGVVMAEATALGLPVVARDTIGAREVLSGVAGARILDSEGSYRDFALALSAAALEDSLPIRHERRKIAWERWGADTVGRELLLLYRAVLDG